MPERTPTWGYNHKTGESAVFDLEKGENLPSGWSDAPKDAVQEPNRNPPVYDRIGVKDKGGLRPLSAEEERKLHYTQPVAAEPEEPKKKAKGK